MTNVDLVRLAGSRARLSDSHVVDPVTAEVIRGGMETATTSGGSAAALQGSSRDRKSDGSGFPVLSKRVLHPADEPRPLRTWRARWVPCGPLALSP